MEVPEDHDNLAAVFDAQSEVVTSVYGDFFIAELIEAHLELSGSKASQAQNDENRALVAEAPTELLFNMFHIFSDVYTSQCLSMFIPNSRMLWVIISLCRG